MESRFEVLEEETHFPVLASKKASDEEPASTAPAADEEEALVATLEAQLEGLTIGGESVKSASRAKELGNECVRQIF